MSSSLVPAVANDPSRRWKILSWITSLAAIGLAVWVTHRYIRHIVWADVVAAWMQLPASRIGASLLAMVISFSMLALFDVLAVREVARDRVSARMAAFAGVLTHGISNALGFQAVTGSAVRYRIYASKGLAAADVARIVGLAGLGVGLGFVTVVAGALCWQPVITHGWGRWPGGALLLLMMVLLVWLARPRTLVLGRWTLTWPSTGIAGAQMLIGGVEMLAAMSALYVLLPASAAPPFVDFLPIYVGAVVAGIVSHSPGGLGVFETIMLASFPPEARADLLAAMMCYRLTYTALPFVLTSAAFVIFEILQRRKKQPDTARIENE
jgi:phosphatidylglycerol lysyltransferase